MAAPPPLPMNCDDHPYHVGLNVPTYGGAPAPPMPPQPLCTPSALIPHYDCPERHPVRGRQRLNNQRRRTTCDSCRDHAWEMLGLHPFRPGPGVPAPLGFDNIDRRSYFHGGVLSQTPHNGWPAVPWDVPTSKGLLTALCHKCEDEALNLCWWRGGTTLPTPPGVPVLAPANFLDDMPREQQAKCYRFPYSTCTCLYTLGVIPTPPVGPVPKAMVPAGQPAGPVVPAVPAGVAPPLPVRNEPLCAEHVAERITKLWATRDRNHDWLSVRTRTAGGGRPVASAAVVARRRTGINPATGLGLGISHRACRCGREVPPPNIGLAPLGQLGTPRPNWAWMCMGCEGYVIDHNAIAGVPIQQYVPGVGAAAGTWVLSANWAPMLSRRQAGRIRWGKYPLRP